MNYFFRGGKELIMHTRKIVAMITGIAALVVICHL